MFGAEFFYRRVRAYIPYLFNRIKISVEECYKYINETVPDL